MIEVLQKADAFLTHCGMNSINELGTGIYLQNDSPEKINETIQVFILLS